MHQPAEVSRSFAVRKCKIEQALSLPQDGYADLSPKGSVDDRIREVIDLLNKMEGIVTTSSCAGRTSVFVEGRKSANVQSIPLHKPQAAVPGGKGLGGHWLFVSHDRLDFESNHDFFMEFGLRGYDIGDEDFISSDTQLIRFQFEPMILHVLAASLHHAKPILSAAVNAGMRESGIQSLKALDNSGACPMVAIRSTGLAHSSVIGYVNEETGELKSLVDRRYLNLMVTTSQQRFEVNAQRIERFKNSLLSESRKALYQKAELAGGDGLVIGPAAHSSPNHTSIS